MKKLNLTEEQQVSILERSISREIVQEIMKYGVTQNQIKSIIYLLALELEDNNLMKEIAAICRS